MCGIAGCVRDGGRVDAVPDVYRMLSVQVHRGPEGMHVTRAGCATFGVCHLRFVDVNGAPQPFRTQDRQLLVAFNGEIYNRKELVVRLTRQGLQLNGQSEAELLAALYLTEGAEMARHLRGMFAIAVFDARRNETVLIRDPLGKKPLNYAVRDGELRFSSELSSLRSVAGGLDPAAIRLYLHFNAVPAPTSLLSGVRKVEPGCVLRISRSNVRSERYWTPRLHPNRERRSGDLKALETALRLATRKRIPAQPFGVFLSGGLDSGLIAAIAAREHTKEIRSYSLSFPDATSFDETPQALHMAAAAGTRHRIVSLPLQQLGTATLRWLAAVDEPIADHSLVPTVVLASAARTEVKAVLTGDGADEFAMGYALFAAAKVLRGCTRALSGRVVQAALEGISRLPSDDRNLHIAHVAERLARVVSTSPERQYYAAASAVPFEDQPRLLTTSVRDAAASVDPFAGLEALLRESPDATPSEQLQLGMICHFLRDVILAKLDRATMLASLEARSPFLDLDVVEMFLGLPESQRLHGLTGKYLVKRVAERYLPHELVHQRKRGFRAPIAPLLRGPLREWISDLLATALLRKGELFRPEAVAPLLAEHLSGRFDHHRVLWSIACLQCWLQRSIPASRSVDMSVAS